LVGQLRDDFCPRLVTPVKRLVHFGVAFVGVPVLCERALLVPEKQA
jgi:hypothetical protein